MNGTKWPRKCPCLTTDYRSIIRNWTYSANRSTYQVCPIKYLVMVFYAVTPLPTRWTTIAILDNNTATRLPSLPHSCHVALHLPTLEPVVFTKHSDHRPGPLQPSLQHYDLLPGVTYWRTLQEGWRGRTVKYLLCQKNWTTSTQLKLYLHSGTN